MKKLFLLSAIALGAMASNAQTISVSVQGEPISNGATVDSNCLEVVNESYQMPNGETIYSTYYLLNPEVAATSSETARFDISVTNTTTDEGSYIPSLLFCWPEICVPVQKGKTMTQSGELTEGVYSPLAIDTGTWDDPYTETFTVSCDVTIAQSGNASNSFSFKINMIHNPADYAAVEGVVADSDLPTVYYDLAGRRVDNPVKGSIVIERRGAKAVKKIMK